VDRVTGLPYDAMDPDLLLWVHACLVDSALLYERLTVGRQTDRERERFHPEQMVAAQLRGLSRDRIPPTVPALRSYIDQVVASGILRVTEAARRVATLFRRPPEGAEWRPVLRAVSWWAFATLPPPVAAMYGVRPTPVRGLGVRASMAALRAVRPAIPRRFRWILPAQLAVRRAA
jgi:uncharacterized protein (DUF2236 family)